MNARDELKRLAEQVIRLERQDGLPAILLAGALKDLSNAAQPGIILALIAENEALDKNADCLDRLVVANKALADSFQAERDQLRAGQDRLKAENEALSGDADAMKAAFGRLRLERDQLKGELKRLRQAAKLDAADLAWSESDSREQSAEISQLKAENERLRQIISDSATACGAAMSTECTVEFMGHLPAEITGVLKLLRAELERAKKDAERFAWLRTHAIGHPLVGLYGDELAAAIDAAMGKAG